MKRRPREISSKLALLRMLALKDILTITPKICCKFCTGLGRTFLELISGIVPGEQLCTGVRFAKIII